MSGTLLLSDALGNFAGEAEFNLFERAALVAPVAPVAPAAEASPSPYKEDMETATLQDHH